MKDKNESIKIPQVNEIKLQRLQNIGNDLVDQNRIEDAQAIFSLITNQFPNRQIGYRGLVRCALKQNNHDMVLNLCNVAISKFSNNTEFILKKISAQISKKQYDKAKLSCKDLLNTGQKEVAYDNLAKISLKNAEYQEAINYSEKAILTNKNKLSNYSIKADSLFLLNQLDLAKENYEKIISEFPSSELGFIGLYKIHKFKHEHETSIKYLQKAYNLKPNNFKVLKLFIETLDYVGQIDQVLKLLEERIQHNQDSLSVPLLITLYSKYGKADKLLELLKDHESIIINDLDIQLKAGLALLRRGNLNAAYDYFEGNLIQEIGNLNLLRLKQRFRIFDFLSLLYSATKCAHLFKHHHIKTHKFPQPLLYPNNEKYQKVIEYVKTGKFIEAEELSRQTLLAGDQSVAAKLNEKFAYNSRLINDLEKNYQESYMDTGESPECVIGLANKIIEKIQTKTPSSIIRLGDGEGKYLTYSSEYTQWQFTDREQCQRGWWGELKFDPKDDHDVLKRFRSSVNNADILGVPEIQRFMLSISNPDKHIDSAQQRGLYTIFNYLNSDAYLDHKEKGCILTSHHFHTDFHFWKLYRFILTDLKSVKVISCHKEISKVISNMFGIHDVELIQIPGQYKTQWKMNYKQSYNPHYPDYYHKIIQEIKPKLGEVYLVAAGFLGKIYCDVIKERGGIGIDLGSTVDLWLNYNTRREHEFTHPIGLSLDLDKLREETFPKYQKMPKTPYYRSNTFGDRNIYCDRDRSLVEKNKEHKRLLIIGHPRCGSNYMAYLFKKMGLDIEHEGFGKDGICSWQFAVKDLNIPFPVQRSNMTPEASYQTEFENVVAYIRDPVTSIPSIMTINLGPNQQWYDFRRCHILYKFGVDIHEYKSDFERAIASYVFWYKIVETWNPIKVFKVEDCVSEVHDFLKQKNWIDSLPTPSQIDLAKNINSTTQRGFTKPEIIQKQYESISIELKEELIRISNVYGYSSLNL